MNKLFRSIAQNVKNAVICTFVYALFLGCGTFLLLVVISAIGYLPYSDRPGPGWYSAHIPNLQEVSYYASWATLFVGPFALLWGMLLFVLVRALGWFATPRWLVRIIAAVIAFFLSLLGLASAGWYIAIAGVVVYGGAGIGSLFGGWILPRFTGTAGPIRSNWLRWAGVSVVVLGSLVVVIYPALPDRDAQSLDVVIERLVPGPEEIGPDSGLRKDEVTVLNSLGLKGKLFHGGIQSSSGSGEKSARALIVIRGTLKSKITLRQPKATNVVYVQDGSTWQIYPSNAPTMRKRITLAEGNGEFEGLTVEIDPVIGKASTFTWYPPIKRVRP
ncbi:MAG TPA: hypothetical protein VOA41_18815 [Candidatus Dormibacteraeota bacterium]|nr:hypothetical protein [Candidatus Dormibacteraeota bacterium]